MFNRYCIFFICQFPVFIFIRKRSYNACLKVRFNFIFLKSSRPNNSSRKTFEDSNYEHFKTMLRFSRGKAGFRGFLRCQWNPPFGLPPSQNNLKDQNITKMNVAKSDQSWARNPLNTPKGFWKNTQGFRFKTKN